MLCGNKDICVQTRPSEFAAGKYYADGQIGPAVGDTEAGQQSL